MGKGTRPILTGIFPRKRLFGLLDRMRRRPVIWVSGPPGCGKTTTVISYMDARNLPCLWYQVDPGDADPATFFYYLGLAAKNTAPRKRKPLPLLTREYLQGIPTFTLRYFEDLFARLNPPFSKGGKKGGFVVVFDNYQEVPEDAPLHEILLNGLSRLPEGIHVLLVSRKDPPPVFIRLGANDAEPKWVFAFGVCAVSGGFYDNYATVQGIDTLIPVDIYVPGCPPRPEMVIDGLLKLQEKVAKERWSDWPKGPAPVSKC